MNRQPRRIAETAVLPISANISALASSVIWNERLPRKTDALGSFSSWLAGLRGVASSTRTARPSISVPGRQRGTGRLRPRRLRVSGGGLGRRT